LRCEYEELSPDQSCCAGGWQPLDYRRWPAAAAPGAGGKEDHRLCDGQRGAGGCTGRHVRGGGVSPGSDSRAPGPGLPVRGPGVAAGDGPCGAPATPAVELLQWRPVDPVWRYAPVQLYLVPRPDQPPLPARGQPDDAHRGDDASLSLRAGHPRQRRAHHGHHRRVAGVGTGESDPGVERRRLRRFSAGYLASAGNAAPLAAGRGIPPDRLGLSVDPPRLAGRELPDL